MAAQFGTKLGIWFWQKNIIEEDQIDVIRYAFEIVCSEILQICIILCYGIISHQALETIFYLVFFQILRRNYEGFHAKTIWQCALLSLSTYFIIMFLYPYLSINILSLLVVVMLCFQIRYCYRAKCWKPLCISSILFMMMLLVSNHMNTVWISQYVLISLSVVLSTLPLERRNQ